jgi:hypothetical protein
VEVLGGGYPLCRTALQPADSGWTYSLRDTDNGITMDAAWSVQLFDGPVSPYWFPTIPVNSHAGRFVLLTANPTTGGTTAGFAPVHHDPSQPLIFTAKHQVAKLSRVLIIPKVQLPSLPTRHR